jgi:hypothetical protein
MFLVHFSCVACHVELVIVSLFGFDEEYGILKSVIHQSMFHRLLPFLFFLRGISLCRHTNVLLDKFGAS